MFKRYKNKTSIRSRTLLPITAEIIYNDRPYQASALQFIKQISCVKDERKGIIVIGHNPGLLDFLNLITKISTSYFSSAAVAFFKPIHYGLN